MHSNIVLEGFVLSPFIGVRSAPHRYLWQCQRLATGLAPVSEARTPKRSWARSLVNNPIPDTDSHGLRQADSVRVKRPGQDRFLTSYAGL